MRYSLFLGCTTPSKGRAYELSARRVLSALGVEYDDVSDFACCGFPIKPASFEASMIASLRNIAISEELGYTSMISLCSGCTVQMVEAQMEYRHNASFRAKADDVLGRLGRRYGDKTTIKHFLRFLYEDIGLDALAQNIKRKFDGLRVAAHYGCHYIKPSDVYGFDSVEDPKTLDRLIEVLGATPVHHRNYLHCCGGFLIGIDPHSTYAIAKEKLDWVKSTGIDCIVLSCPFCANTYDDNQKLIEQEFSVEYRIPVLYYSQLLGLAMGFSPKDVGLNLNKVKASELLAKLGIME